MKTIILLCLFAFTACDQTSSPEGRVTIRMENIQQELDSLKKQNAMILDSLGKIHEELRRLSH